MSRLRKSAAVVCFSTGLLLAGAIGIHSMADEEESGAVSVSLDSIGGSGVSGSASYGSSITARATGMDPDKAYYSFVYGAGSDATGNNPCILTGESLAGPTNTVGEWDVDKNGNGTLTADAPISADRAGTMSIREDTLNTGGALGPLPLNKLVACGEVGEEKDTLLGTVQDQVPQLPSTKAVTDLTGPLPDGVVDDGLADITDDEDNTTSSSNKSKSKTENDEEDEDSSDSEN